MSRMVTSAWDAMCSLREKRKLNACPSCAKAYIEAFGGLFEGGDVSAQAQAVRKDLRRVTADCKDALAAA